MSQLLALSLSVAILGGIWGFLSLGPISDFAFVWAGFVAAGCFFAAGGDTKALSKTIVGMIYGAIIGWIALIIIAKVHVPLPSAIWPGIVVGVTVFFLPIVASVELLSFVPGNVLGYATIVAYTASANAFAPLSAVDRHNPLVSTVISIILGGVLGYLIGQFAGVLKTKAAK